MGKVQFVMAVFILLNVFFTKPDNAISNSIHQKQICAYDKNCYLIFNKKNKIKKIKPGISSLLSLLSEDIKKIANIYEVDPRALAAVIATENTLNVNVDDEAQDYLASFGITSVFGKKFSYGLGQIFPSVAFVVDHIVAKYDRRAAFNFKQVASALVHPKEALKYAAAILKNAQDKYAQAGFFISDDIAILATLYNVGKIDERLQKINKDHAPRSNYFGLFAFANIATIEDAIGWSPKHGDYNPKYKLSKDLLKNKNHLTRPINIFPSPQRCHLQVTRDKRLGLTSYKPTIKASGEYQLVRSTLGCKLERWSLIRFLSGEMGWARNKQLKINSVYKDTSHFPTSVKSLCRIKHMYPVRINDSKSSDIKDYFNLKCHLPAITDYQKGQQKPCNIKLDETIVKLIKVLNSQSCLQKILVPNRYLFHYIYSNYEELRPLTIFDNLHRNEITFYSQDSSDQIISYLPE